jgi:LysM repeat protein
MARTIIVKAGDTLSGIAETCYGSAALALKIARYNGLGSPDLLQVGERLEIPSRTELDGPRVVPEPAHGFVTPPNGLDGIIQTFGNIAVYLRNDGHLKPEWETQHLATARLPFSIPLSWDRSQKVRGIYCNKLLVPVIADLFSRIDSQGLAGEIRTFGGCFNYRPKRQSSKLSTHCWGIAIDLNPETNRQGSAGDMHPELVALFREYGFKWGGDWSGASKDPMHFQYCSGY